MELKTIDGWCKSDCGSWDEYCKPGEVVDEGVADYFLNILPPRTMKMGYFQVGEPHSTAVNPKTKRYSETYGFHDMRMTQARMEAFVPGGDAVLADVYRRVRGTRSWHPVVKELKKLLDEREGKAV